MTVMVNEWLAEARARVGALDAELIAVRVFAPEGADRSWLAVHDDEVVAERGLARAEEFLKRRADGEPLAYIFGSKEFYGREFRVSSEVLIPRPETEGLIELIKGLDLPKDARFLEIGTGSGCIAVTLAAEFPETRVVATDVSEGALTIAKANAAIVLDSASGSGLVGECEESSVGRVEFYQGDLLEALPEKLGDFEVLVANLPYVDENWEWLDKGSLAAEPSLALYAEDGGLALYRKLILQIRERGEGFTKYVVFEADPCQHEDLIRFAEGQGLSLVKTEGFGVVFRVVE